jgi:hypothetical protein
VPAYFPLPPSGLHRWLVAELERLEAARGTRLNVVAPRGAAKSTWVSLAYPLWAACEEREPYVLLLSDTGDQANAYLESLRIELESNEALAAAYPAACGKGPVWQEKRLRLRNGVVVEALGTGGKVRGRKNRHQRPTLVVVDDPQNNDTITSPVQRQRDWDWLTREVLEVGGPDTNYLVVGTALHREAIVCRLQQAAGWRSKVFKAVEAWPERMDLWREWEGLLTDPRLSDEERDAQAKAFHAAHRALMEAGARVLWPEREPLLALMQKRAAIGPAAFASEKQSDPVNPEDCEWPAEWFEHPLFWFDEWPQDLVVSTLALDPSKGRDAKRGDYSAYVRYGRDRAGTEYVEADLQRRDAAAIVEDGVAHLKAFRPEAFSVEGNGFQELFEPLFAAAFARERLEVTVHLEDNTVPKPVRVRRLTAPLAKRRLRFKARSPGTAKLVQQLKDFPVGEHDDGPDALEMARRRAVELFNG